ncbi:MAG TPA: helix-turn-helix transcriptional regulator [Caulobacteraceae bacterium]
MTVGLSEKLAFALKALSLSRIQLAAELGVDKSVVGRWVTGAVAPSAHNLAKLTVLVAERVSGFTVLDWDRDLGGLAAALGVETYDPAAGIAPVFGDGLPLALLDQSASITRLRGGAYEGFFRSTRPYAQYPGKFIHDHMLIRRRENGLVGYHMKTGGVSVEGWVLLLQNQLFCIGSELTSGSMAFAIFNGVSTVTAGRLDGLILSCALDTARTPTATAMVVDRIGDITDDEAADRAHLIELASHEPVAPDGSLDPDLVVHLLRNSGPEAWARGGDLLLRMPLLRSLSRGIDPT